MSDDLGVLVAEAGDARSTVQCCDVLLHAVSTRRAARRWTTTALADYPGCVVAVAYDVTSRWCLVEVRGVGAVSITALHKPLDRVAIREFGVLSYLDWIGDVEEVGA